MLPAKSRMRRRQDFGLAVRSGQRAGRPLVVIHLVRPSEPATPPELQTISGRAARAGSRAPSNRSASPKPHASAQWAASPKHSDYRTRSASAKVGFVVSRRVGGAVVRNRVRRRLRHAMRDRLHRLPPGSFAVVRANAGAADASYAELAGQLDRALEQVLRRPARIRS